MEKLIRPEITLKWKVTLSLVILLTMFCVVNAVQDDDSIGIWPIIIFGMMTICFLLAEVYPRMTFLKIYDQCIESSYLGIKTAYNKDDIIEFVVNKAHLRVRLKNDKTPFRIIPIAQRGGPSSLKVSLDAWLAHNSD